MESIQALDFVISEAKKYGVHLILSLVNNWEGFGGKKQYVQWARDKGQYLGSEDDFFRNEVVKQFYKNHVNVRTLTGFSLLFHCMYTLASICGTSQILLSISDCSRQG